MPHHSAYAELSWLAQRCNQFFPQLHRPSRRELHQLLASQPQEPAADGDTGHTPLIEALAGLIGLHRLDWQETPNPDALPLLALIPGTGCRVIYGRSNDGQWLAEGPQGSQRLVQLPADGQYAPLSAPADKSGPLRAIDLFKAALLERREIFFQAGLASFIANLLALGTSVYSMQVYDRVMPTQGLSTLAVLTTGTVIAIMLELVIKMTRSRALDISVKGMDLELSHKIFLRLLGIRLDQFPPTVGTLSAQVRSYESIRSFASAATLYIAVDAPFALLFLLVTGAIAGPLVAAVPAVFFCLSLAVGLFYRRRIAEHARNANNAGNMKLGLLVETVENAEAIKAQGAGWQQLHRWNLLNRLAVDDELQLRHYSEQATYYAAFLQQVSYVFLVAAGAWVAATSNALTMGGLIAASILSGRILAPVAALPGLLVQWAHAKAALDNLEKVFELHNDNHEVLRPLTPEKLRGEYHLEGVKFAYRGQPQPMKIEHLHINAGEKVGILGPIGSGKSTLLKLIAGLYGPLEGRLLLDGLDLQQISRPHLSERIGYLPQDTRLFSGRLRDNLTAGLTGISEEQILAACQATGLSALIAGHPKGLDLEIAEGGNGVSGGQRQLIALTRLLLGRPEIWLLDEPTAAMDDQSEARSLQALRQSIGREQTLIVVTHKPSLLGLVDRLVIVTPAGIVLDGPRDQVLERLRQPAPQPVSATIVPGKAA